MTLTPRLTDRPLEASFSRVGALSPYLGVRIADGAPGSFGPDEARFVAEGAGRYYGTRHPRVRAMLGFSGAVFHAAMPVLAVYLAEQRVPCLDPTHTSVEWPDLAPPGRLVVCGAYTGLRDDPASRDSATHLVSDTGELREALVTALEAQIAAIVDAFETAGPLRAGLLWRAAADSVSGGLPWLGELLGDEERGRREALAVTGRPGSRLAAPKARFELFRSGDLERIVYLRGTCCLSYKLDEGAYCMTCPLLDDEERRARIGAWIVEDEAEHVEAAHAEAGAA